MFQYKDSAFYCEEVSLEKIAKEVGTPCYVYSKASFGGSLKALKNAFKKVNVEPLICYSVKVASNIALLNLAKEEGAGADIVSGGELFRALKAGIDPRKIVFSGVGKTKDEIIAALKTGI